LVVLRRDDSTEFRIKQSLDNDAIDSKFGFDRIKDATERVGWLLNMHSVSCIF
jgi:DNA polymerase epsilon subunit 1